MLIISYTKFWKFSHKAVTDTFGGKAVIQRCQVHKKRDVLAQLPKSEQANTGLQISMAYLENDYDKAKKALNLLTNNLEHRYPKAAASLREGLEETLTVHRLKVPGLLRQTLSNTNEQILRYAAAGFLEAEKSFRRIKGYRQIPLLVSAIGNLLSLSITKSA